MPVYDYKCKECEFIEEYVFKISEKPDILVCPKCNKEMCNQLTSVPFKLKGYSWSIDNYGNGVSKEQLNNRSKYKDEYAKIKPAKTGEMAPNVKNFINKKTSDIISK